MKTRIKKLSKKTILINLIKRFSAPKTIINKELLDNAGFDWSVLKNKKLDRLN